MRRVTQTIFNFSAWVNNKLVAYPKLLIFSVCVVCGFSLNYTLTNLGINTDTTEMLSQNLPFQKNRERLIQAFPQDDQAFLIVVDSNTPLQTTHALNELAKQLRSEKNYVESVYVPGESGYFDRHGLLYLEIKALEDLASKLVQAQPFIGTLSQDNSLNGLFSIIGLAISSTNIELPIDIVPLLERIREAIRAAIDNDYNRLSWHDLMSGNKPDLLTTQRFVLVKPKLEFDQVMPAEKSYQAIHAILKRTKGKYPLVRLRLTGEIALEHEELESVSRSALIASIFSLLLVCVALMIGLRSFKLMIATLMTLVMGLILTAGFATFAVGHLNLISIAFAVLYIGLGVDYSIHFCLRYRELLQQEFSSSRALTHTIGSVGPSIALCAITTSAGFYAFIPTSYRGVSELGIIAGSGMFIGLVMTLIILPALLKLMPLKSVGPYEKSVVFPDWIYRLPTDHRTFIKWSALVLSIIAGGLVTQVSFDFNPVNLRDPSSESVSTFKDLLKSKATSPMTLTVLANDEASVRSKSESLKALDSVENAITLFDFIPEDQEEKLAIIEELALLLGLELSTFPNPTEVSVEESIRTLEKFLNTIDTSLTTQKQGSLSESLGILRRDLEEYLAILSSLPKVDRKDRLDQLQSSLLSSLPETMNRLLKGFEADIVTIDELPKDLLERWVSNDGIYRIMIFPSKDLNNIDNLREFITDVQRLEPNATDLPVIYLESGKEIVNAFLQALLGALAVIAVVLIVVQRNIVDTLMILAPLLMAAVFTCALTVFFGKAFNFANIIAVPLLLGLGVDSGIHVIRRLHTMPTQKHRLLRTSTARAIFFSGLTTLFSFVSLAFTPHLGLASMGQLLAIGISFIVFCTLIVLPAIAVRN